LNAKAQRRKGAKKGNLGGREGSWSSLNFLLAQKIDGCADQTYSAPVFFDRFVDADSGRADRKATAKKIRYVSAPFGVFDFIQGGRGADQIANPNIAPLGFAFSRAQTKSSAHSIPTAAFFLASDSAEARSEFSISVCMV
jgi:hypothetical protein